MSGSLDRFEPVVRSIGAEVVGPPPAPTEAAEPEEPHPFETRNIHPDLPTKVRKLFDDGHWEQSVFEAFKFIEKEVKRISGIRGKTGYALMMEAFNENSPKVQLNGLATESEIDEQKGFKFIFSGAATGSGIHAATKSTSAIPRTRPWTIWPSPRSCCGGLTPLACASSPRASRGRCRADQ